MDAIPEASPQHHKKFVKNNSFSISINLLTIQMLSLLTNIFVFRPKLNHPSDIASVTNNQKELTDEIYPHNSLNSNITYPIKVNC